MTYALIAVLVLQTFVFVWLTDRIQSRAVTERRALEDCIIALTDRDAAVLVHATEHFEPGDVKYVDEQREWELSPSADGFRD